MKRRLTGLVQRGLRHAASDRDHPLGKIVLRSAGLTRQPADDEIDKLAASASAALAPLLGIAMSGNVHAIRKVTELAAHLCAETTTLACMHQTAADTVARERFTWPINLSHDPKERRRALRLVTGPRRLPLGEGARMPAATQRPAGFSSPATAAVLVALKAIEIERSFRIPSELFPTLQPKWSAAAARLPELRPVTAPAWFEVIWLYINERHGGAPEKSDLVRILETPAAARASSGEPNAHASLRHALEEAFLRLAQGRGDGRTRHRRRRTTARETAPGRL